MWAASALFPQGKESLQYYAQEFKKMTADLITEYSYTLHGISGTRIDIVGNVINLLTVRWAADYLVSPFPPFLMMCCLTFLAFRLEFRSRPKTT